MYKCDVPAHVAFLQVSGSFLKLPRSTKQGGTEMKLFAKILVVVLLLLSTAFAVAQMTLYSKREMYREKYEETSAVLEKTEQELTETTSALEDVRTQLDNLRSDTTRQIRDLEQKVESEQLRARKLEKETEEQQTVIQESQNRLRELADRIEQKNNIIEELEKKVASLDGSLKNALNRIEQLEGTVEAKEAQIEQLNNRIAALKEEKKHVQERMEDMEAALSTLEERGVHIPGRTVPAIDANVVRVDKEVGAVVLDKGKDDGVEAGFAFTIYRDASFVARAYAVEVYESYTLARIDRDISETQNVEVGDNATTRISLLD
jgi:peptidoglycan hydrolase CwlO-like protein